MAPLMLLGLVLEFVVPLARPVFHLIAGRAPSRQAFATENAKQCALNAVQIFGGMGYNTEAVPEKLVRDSLIGTCLIGLNSIFLCNAEIRFCNA